MLNVGSMKPTVCVLPRGRKDGPASPDVHRSKRSRDPVKFTLQSIEPFFHVPQVQAARALGVSLTTMKQICRRLDIVRWPYRRPCHRRQSLERMSDTQRAFSTGERIIREQHDEYESEMQAGKGTATAHLDCRRSIHARERARPSSGSQSIANASRGTSELVARALPEASARFYGNHDGDDAKGEAETLSWLPHPELDVGQSDGLFPESVSTSNASATAHTDSSRAPTPERSAVLCKLFCKLFDASNTAKVNGLDVADETLSWLAPVKTLHHAAGELAPGFDGSSSAEDYPLHVWV